jgi:hypothetical protein
MRSLRFLIFLLISNALAAQEIPANILEKMEKTSRIKNTGQIVHMQDIPIIQRGTISLLDGNYFHFRKLSIINDTVSFRDTSRVDHQYPLSEISRIQKFKPKPLEGAGYGLGCGGFLGYFTGLLAYPEDNFFETLRIIFSNDENEDWPRFSKKATPILMGCCLAGAVVGTLIGLSSYKQQNIFQTELTIGMNPEIINLTGEKNAFVLTCKIKAPW